VPTDHILLHESIERRLAALEDHSYRQAACTNWQWLAEDRSKSIEALVRVSEELTAERNAARDLLTDAEHTRDMALSRVDEVEHDRDRIWSDLSNRTIERDHALHQRDRLGEAVACDPDEHDSYLRQLAAMTASRDALIGELHEAYRRKDTSDTQCDALKAQLDNANNELLQADDELAAARLQLAEAEHTRDMALSRVDEVEHERDTLQNYLDALAVPPPTEGHEACTFPCPECDPEPAPRRPSPSEAAKATCERCNPPAAPCDTSKCCVETRWETTCSRGTHGCGLVHEEPRPKFCVRCNNTGTIQWDDGSQMPCDVCGVGVGA